MAKTRSPVIAGAGIAMIAAAAAVSLYQIFTFPLAGTYFPLSLILSLVCGVFVRLKPEDKTILLISVLYMLLVLVSGAWSPDKGSWANGVLYQSMFFFGYFASRSYPAISLAGVVKLFLYAAALNAVLVVVFRLLPDLKNHYLQSSIIDLFRNPKRLSSVFFHPNTLDPNKSGGIFDNANTGAAFNLMCIGAVISLRRYINATIGYGLLSLFVVAVIASGSKSALIIMVAVVAICASLYMFRQKKQAEFVIIVLLGICLILTLPLQDLLLASSHTAIGSQTVNTTGDRLKLWTIAITLFVHHPILGLGFGGWQTNIAPVASYYGIDPNWPPHNSIVSAWSDSGTLAALTIITIWGVVFLRLTKAYLQSKEGWRATGAIYAMIGVGAMSLGDPFPLLGGPNMAFPLGCIVALGVSSARPTATRTRSRGRLQDAPDGRGRRRSGRVNPDGDRSKGGPN